MRKDITDDLKGNTMKRPYALSLLLLLALIGFASQASGQGRFASYVELKGGIYSPSATFDLHNVDLNTTFNAATKTGLNGEIAFGHYFLPSLALELGVGYFRGRGSIAEAAPQTLNFNVIPVILSAKALIPIGPVDPYAELGIGAYFTKFNATDNGASFSGSSTLGLSAGAGLNVNVTPSMFIGVEGRYVSANPSFGNQTIKLNDSQQYALNGFKLNGFTTTLALGYSF